VAVVGDEGGRDAEGEAARVGLQESGAGDVPRGIAARLESGAQPAGGEARGVGLALYQLLAGEFDDHAAVRERRDEGLVLFSGESREGVEPVGVVGGAVFGRPLLHGRSDNFGDLEGKFLLAVLYLEQFGVNGARQALAHHIVRKAMISIDIRKPLDGLRLGDSRLAGTVHDSLLERGSGLCGYIMQGVCQSVIFFLH
jgi:hypothetical protein